MNRDPDGYLNGGVPALILGGLIFSLICFGIVRYAAAQSSPHGVSDLVTSQALSNVSGNCLAANADRKTLSLDNIAGTINIGYCETNAAVPGTPCTAAIGSGGTTTLTAGSLHYFVPAPVNQFCFIAASGTPTFTIREGR